MFTMKKLIVLPIMLSLVSIIGSSPVEAKRNRFGVSGSGRPGVSVPKRPRKCNLCQPKIRIPKKCNLCQRGRQPIPMPRGGFLPHPGTQWR